MSGCERLFSDNRLSNIAGIVRQIAPDAEMLGIRVADARGIEFVYLLCSFLPVLGLATILLPSEKSLRA